MDVKLKYTDKIEQLPIDRVVTLQSGLFSIADTEYKIADFEIEEVITNDN